MKKKTCLRATLAIRLDHATLEALRGRADQNDRSVSHEVRHALKAWLAAHGKQAG